MAFYKKNRAQKEKTGKKDRKAQIITIMVGAIMVLSIIGYMWSDNTETSNYKKFKFQQTQNGWMTKISGNTHYFWFHPTQLEQIKTESSTVAKIKNSPQIYITHDPKNKYPEYVDLAKFELAKNLFEKGIYIVNAATTNETNLETASCELNKTLTIIQLEEGNETKIIENGNCIRLQASSGMDFIALKDRLLYGFYGIMD